MPAIIDLPENYVEKEPNSFAVSKRYFLPPKMDTLTDSASGSVAYLRGNEIWVTVFGR
jgi:hypothetical protein